MKDDELDSVAVGSLVQTMYDVLEAHYERSRGGRISVYEALSGMAIVIALTLKATKLDVEALAFFTEALRTNLQEVKDDLEIEQKPH